MARTGNPGGTRFRQRRGAFKLEAPDPSEIEIHEAIARYLDAALPPEVQWTSLAVGHGLLTDGETSRLSKVGVKSGWPDLVIVWAGKIFGFEIKSKSGRLSRTRIVKTKRGALREVVGQQERFEMLGRAGMRVTIVRSLDAMIAAMNALGIPHRGPVRSPVGLRPVAPTRPAAPPIPYAGGVNPAPPSPPVRRPAARAIRVR